MLPIGAIRTNSNLLKKIRTHLSWRRRASSLVVYPGLHLRVPRRRPKGRGLPQRRKSCLLPRVVPRRDGRCLRIVVVGLDLGRCALSVSFGRRFGERDALGGTRRREEAREGRPWDELWVLTPVESLGRREEGRRQEDRALVLTRELGGALEHVGHQLTGGVVAGVAGGQVGMGRVVAGVVGVRRLVLYVCRVGGAVHGLLDILRPYSPAGPPPRDAALRSASVGHLEGRGTFYPSFIMGVWERSYAGRFCIYPTS